MDRDIIRINGPLLGDEEARAVVKVLESGVLTSPEPRGGPAVRRLERAAREFTGARHAVAVNSGTGALQAALMALGVGAGDEVVVPSFSYVATANAVLSVGAVPVFADIRDDYTMDPDVIPGLVTRRTACIMPVHLYGRAADVPAISRAAGDTPIIEDAAQSLGTTIRGHHAGTLSDVGCYSFYPGKVATSGEGGVVVTGDDYVYGRLLAVRNHGNDDGQFRTLGLNLRMPEVCAAVGAVQMGKLPSFLKRRRRNAALLSETLRDTGLGLPEARDGENPNWSLYTVTSPRRDALLESLNRNRVGAAIYYKTPIHVMPHYRNGASLPATEEAARRVLSIPVHPGLTPEDMEYVAEAVRRGVSSRSSASPD